LSCHNFSQLIFERNHSNIREEDLVVTAIGVFLTSVKKSSNNRSIKKYYIVEYLRNVGRLLQIS